jgi:hypothetical protein
MTDLEMMVLFLLLFAHSSLTVRYVVGGDKDAIVPALVYLGSLFIFLISAGVIMVMLIKGIQ